MVSVMHADRLRKKRISTGEKGKMSLSGFWINTDVMMAIMIASSLEAEEKIVPSNPMF
jgi:hypothetical protein